MKFVLVILILLGIITDLFLLSNQGYSRMFIWNILQILSILVGLLALKCVYDISFKYCVKDKSGSSIYFSVFKFLTLVTILASFMLAINKKSLDWDSVALYEARAKFLQYGIKFSDMLKLSQHDDLNSYYYLLYPPFTSILHYFWISPDLELPSATMYPIYLLVLATSLYWLSKNRLGKTAAIVLAFLSVSNIKIFGLSFFEYSNLPYTVYTCVGLMMTLKYLETKKWQVLIVGAYVYSTSLNIRFSEPTLPALLITCIMSYILTKRGVFIKIFGTFSLFLTIKYLSWLIFTRYIAEIDNYTNINMLSLLESTAGLFVGSVYNYTLLFFKSLFPSVVLFLSAIFLPFNKKYVDMPEIIFIKVYIFVTLAIYFTGFYILSFSNEWWRSALSESLIRSTIFLIPLSGYIILRHVHN